MDSDHERVRITVAKHLDSDRVDTVTSCHNDDDNFDDEKKIVGDGDDDDDDDYHYYNGDCDGDVGRRWC